MSSHKCEITDEEISQFLQSYSELDPTTQEQVSRHLLEVESEFDARRNNLKLLSDNMATLLNNIDKQFDELTKFNKYDWSIFAIAIALQCLRQYLVTAFPERYSHKQAEEKVKGKKAKKNKREYLTHRLYHPTLEEISCKPVPFDTNYGSPDLLGKGKGLNGQHHTRTLGHDPLLGYFFGTMNILTSTVTLNDLQSFHVGDIETIDINGVHAVKDHWNSRADFDKIIKYSKQRIFDEGPEGKQALAIALTREFIHLRSDLRSLESLPLPVVQYSASAETAQQLCDYGIDLLNVQAITLQAALSVIINYIIQGIHFLIKPKNVEANIYKAKTKSIVLFSNIIATESNLLFCGITGKMKYLDIGGLLVTIWRIIKDFDTIEKIRQHFKEEKLEEILSDPKNIHLCPYLKL